MLPDKLQITFYGDDFTGSTDAMESLALAGLRTVLFLDAPDPEALKQFPELRAAGLAGNSRAMDPVRMEECLRPAFAGLKTLGAPLVHYKVCSTFDSSPEIGSIGKALEIGADVFQCAFVPVLAGAPILGRYCVFGNVFARSGLDSPVFRLDRHPTMSRHPVTPMSESDLRLHLARQTAFRSGLVDVLDLDAPTADLDRRFNQVIASGERIVLFDVLHDQHLAKIGRLLVEHSSPGAPLFIVGSSGVEYALTAYWRQEGLLPPSVPRCPPARCEQMLVVSGSCSPVSDRQMAWALEHGYREIPLDTMRFAAPDEMEAELERGARAALDLLDRGVSPILHTCRGPLDPRLAAVRERWSERGADSVGQTIGRALGRLLRRILGARKLRRVMVVGGDTSAFVGQELGITSLELAAPIQPGGPLCLAHGTDSVDGLEIVFKGGQVGRIDYFGRAQGLATE